MTIAWTHFRVSEIQVPPSSIQDKTLNIIIKMMESYSWIKYSLWITAETNIRSSTGKEEENNEDFMGINGIIKMRIN